MRRTSMRELGHSIEPYQWVIAPLMGTPMRAWYTGRTADGGYEVEFSEDAPRRRVDWIRPLDRDTMLKRESSSVRRIVREALEEECECETHPYWLDDDDESLDFNRHEPPEELPHDFLYKKRGGPVV